MITVGVPYSKCKFKSAVPCTREDEAIAFAAGVTLGGGKARVFMQDSGFGHCLDVITSLLQAYRIPVHLDILERNTPAHHARMGELLPKLLNIMEGSHEKI